MNIRSGFSIVKSNYTKLCQKIGASYAAPSQKQIQITLLVVGVTLLVAGLTTGAHAQLQTEYNDERISRSVNMILTYLEGSFGALVMVAAGLGAILSSAFGQYRAALGCLVVAVGSFILRSILGTFFNDDVIQR